MRGSPASGERKSPSSVGPMVQLGRERQKRLYVVMVDHATRGAKLPCNRELKEAVGIPPSGNSALHAATQRLVAEGRIEMQYCARQGRRVLIVATGALTEWAFTNEERKPRPRKTARRWGVISAPKKVVKSRRPPSPKPAPRIKTVSRLVPKRRPLLASRGYSDTFLYGHLADAVRECRRRGDVIYRNPKCKTEILINGRLYPGGVKARAAWHKAHSVNRNILDAA